MVMKRNRKKLAILSFAAGIAAILTIAFAFREESGDFKLVKNLDIYYSLFRELNTFYVDDIDPDKLVKTSIDEMLQILDPYTVYYPESELDDFRFMTTGKYGGIGSLIRRSGDYTVLTQIYKGFPADIAGLKAGDILKEINGRSLKELAVDKVSDRLKGDPDTEVTIKIERDGDEFIKTLVRKRIAIPSVPYYGMLDSETGYIRFTNFTQDCSKDVKEALVSLKSEHNALKIILDLRSNPGGLLPEAVDVVNLFVGPGEVVVSTKGKVSNYDHTYKTTRQAVDEDIPLVVMINRNSASAAEIVAGAIQDLDRGVIAGQRSYGKGLVQISRPLSYNTTLKVTTAKYYIPSGRCIQALDFSNRNEDGSVGHIPDSLISEYETKNGRIVKDGGGIVPDYSVEAPQLSQLATELFIRQYIFDFATMFSWRNEKIAGPDEYSLSEAEYQSFGKFLEERGFSYETASQDALDRLIEVARREKYYESNESLFDELKGNMEQNLFNDLHLFREEIIKLLENEIVGRYYYEEGLIKHIIKSDEQINRALEIINDNKLYSSALTGDSVVLSSGPLTLNSKTYQPSLRILRNGEAEISC